MGTDHPHHENPPKHEPPHEPTHHDPPREPHDPPREPHDPPGEPGHGQAHDPGASSGSSTGSSSGSSTGSSGSSSGTTVAPPGASSGLPAPGSTGTGSKPASGATLPDTPLTAAATSLAKLAKYDDPGSIGKNPGGATEVQRRFENASDSLGSSWGEFQDKFLAAEKKRVQDAGLSWSKDGYEAAAKQLPGIDKTLEEWQALKEKNPFDSEGFTKLANQLATQVHDYEWMLENGARFASSMTMTLTKGLEAICSEVARQALTLNDPVPSVTADLDSMSGVLSARARSKFDQALKSDRPDKVWSRAKDSLVGTIKDKSVAKDVNAIFAGGLGPDLRSWNDRIKPPIDGTKLTAINRSLADTLASYDRQLADIETRNMDMSSVAAVAGLREALHAIAARISHDTKWVAQQGAFAPPQ